MKIFFYTLLVLALISAQVIRAEEDKEASDDAEVTTEEVTEGEETDEKKEEKEDKPLELEDKKLWQMMDLDGDGKLTVAEYERFSMSPNAQAFVRQMKENKAIEEWAKEKGVDVEKAKAAMMVGANAQRQQTYANQLYYARLQAQQRRQAIARRNQQIYQAQQQQQNYWSRLGQMYYQAMQRRGGRTEL